MLSLVHGIPCGKWLILQVLKWPFPQSKPCLHPFRCWLCSSWFVSVFHFLWGSEPERQLSWRSPLSIQPVAISSSFHTLNFVKNTGRGEHNDRFQALYAGFWIQIRYLLAKLLRLSQFLHLKMGIVIITSKLTLFLYLFLAGLGLCWCTRAFFSCSVQGFLFISERGLLNMVTSLVVQHRL